MENPPWAFNLSNSRIKESLAIDRVITDLGVLTLAVRTTPDLSENVLSRTHFDLCCISTTIKTMSFNWKFLFFWDHFRLRQKLDRNSFIQRHQKINAQDSRFNSFCICSFNLMAKTAAVNSNWVLRWL